MQFSSIETPRLSLVLGTEPVLEAVLRGDRSLGKLLGVEVPFGWTEFGDPIFRFSLDMVRENALEALWWTYLPVLREEKVLIGSCGYKGPPDKEGVVEIGYEIAKPFRLQGLATELAMGLIHKAFSYPQVTAVKAHTLAEINASGSVLKKCGMEKVAELFDPEDGDIWQWVLNRPAAMKS
ncbi:MAG: GNAT family N-acetyltransferase [Saprospirales bacterium]|nr:GNAT family N-acetyltransferase [Saprospirales bacterium]